MRVLITGSREWTDELTIERVFSAFPEGSTIVSGAARGSDALCRTAILKRAMFIEEHPVYNIEWERLGKKAGVLRNQRMVDKGADICVAFPTASSTGTWDCMERACAAGIPTFRVKQAHEQRPGEDLWEQWTPEKGRKLP